MTDDQLQAIRNRASGADPLASWGVLQARADRQALLALVDQLLHTTAAFICDAVPAVHSTHDTTDLPDQGPPLVVRVLADSGVYRFSDTFSHWLPGHGWRTDVKGSRRAWSTLAMAQDALREWLAGAPPGRRPPRCSCATTRGAWWCGCP
jgi:hypothetical protein